MEDELKEMFDSGRTVIESPIINDRWYEVSAGETGNILCSCNKGELDYEEFDMDDFNERLNEECAYYISDKIHENVPDGYDIDENMIESYIDYRMEGAAWDIAQSIGLYYFFDADADKDEGIAEICKNENLVDDCIDYGVYAKSEE